MGKPIKKNWTAFGSVFKRFFSRKPGKNQTANKKPTGAIPENMLRHIERLSSKDPDTLKHALSVLERNRREVIPALRIALRHGNEKDRKLAAFALGTTGLIGDIPFLQVAEKREKNHAVKIELNLAIEKIRAKYASK